jgi:predicted ester cyclase
LFSPRHQYRKNDRDEEERRHSSYQMTRPRILTRSFIRPERLLGLVPVMAPSRPKQGALVKRTAEEGWRMRYLSAIVAPLGISATLLVGQAVAQVEPLAPPECPIKTAVENTVIARAWHEDVINRRNPAILQDILASDIVHHAAGGYPKVMDATGIAAMMAEFLTAFPDLRYTFDQFIVQDDYVVERYTAVGTQQGQLGDLPPSGRAWRITEVGPRALKGAPS